MQLKEFSILLDIKKHKKAEYIEIVKGDSETNIFNIQLLSDLNKYDLTGLKTEIAFYKSDGTTVLQDEENGVSILNSTEGKIQCILKTNTIASPGKVIAEVRVLSVIDSKLLTSTKFEFFVRNSIVNDETVVSTNEFPILNQLISTTEGLIQQVGLIEAQVPAQVVTDLNAVSLLANQLNLDLVAHKADYATQIANRVKKDGDALDGVYKFGNLYQNILSYSGNSRKIVTNMTFDLNVRYTIILEGKKHNADSQDYRAIYLILSLTPFTTSNYYASVSSFNTYKPEIKFGQENGKLVLFINDSHTKLINVRCISTNPNIDAFKNWNVVNEEIVGTAYTVPYI